MDYDVIVIGSGTGELTAAVTLAQAGLYPFIPTVLNKHLYRRKKRICNAEVHIIT